jgi:pimeloyl-ACP methyl ester carboxylesterase
MKKRTIFMIHGMWGGSWCWDEHKEYFEAKGYRCVAPTLLLHDPDENERYREKVGRLSLKDYIADLEKQIIELDEKPILMGHSMGGLLALILASKGLAKAAILITLAPPRGVFVLRWPVVRSFLSGLRRWCFWNRAFKQTFREASHSMLHLLPEAEQRVIYKKFVYESGRAGAEIGLALLDKGRASEIKTDRIPCPVLVIGAEKDRITPAVIVRKVAERFDLEYEELKDHSHWVIREDGWEDIAHKLDQWIRRKVG